MTADLDSCGVDGTHAVQFHESDDELVSVVGGFFARVLQAGDAVLAIATPAHRMAFVEVIRAAGIDTGAAVEARRLVLLDASDTLDLFAPAGGMQRARFRDVIGGQIRAAGVSGRPVRAFGEMVSLLWERGEISAAMDLEAAWSDLAQDLPFSLLCSYPRQLFVDPASAAAFHDVCHAHSHVVTGPPMPADVDAVRCFSGSPHSSRLARRFVREKLHEWGREDLVDDAVVITAELVTNAIVHAGSDVAVGMRAKGRRVRLVVTDCSDTPPTVRQESGSSLNGRGLQMVDVLAADWGHRAVDGGKLVWVDLHGSGNGRRSVS